MWVSAHVLNQTDFRAHAHVRGWIAAALFGYVATFLVLFARQGTREGGRSTGSSYMNVLLTPFPLLTRLVQGARNRLPIISSFPQRRASTLPVLLSGPAVFFAPVAAYVAEVRLPRWARLLAAFAAAVASGVLALVPAATARVGLPARPMRRLCSR